jgi:hypothetical protein
MNWLGKNQFCGIRRLKKPGWPNISALRPLAFCCQTAIGAVKLGGHMLVVAVILFQKSRRRAKRFSGELPAMIAALIAPIEIPATQSGIYSDDAKAS